MWIQIRLLSSIHTSFNLLSYAKLYAQQNDPIRSFTEFSNAPKQYACLYRFYFEHLAIKYYIFQDVTHSKKFNFYPGK
jgi:hypothetical protein